MTEEPEIPLNSPEEQARIYASPDWYLQHWVDLVNGSETALPVTLFVKGLVISGLMVSGHLYFEAMAEGLERYLDKDHENTKGAIEELTKPGANYLKQRDAKDYPFPYYIHLKGAKLFSAGGSPMPDNGMWWRGRVSEVDAFSFGVFATTAANSE